MPTALVAMAATIDVTDVMYLMCAASHAAAVTIAPVLCHVLVPDPAAVAHGPVPDAPDPFLAPYRARDAAHDARDPSRARLCRVHAVPADDHVAVAIAPAVVSAMECIVPISVASKLLWPKRLMQRPPRLRQ